MPKLIMSHAVKSLRKRQHVLTGRVVLGASGAVSSVDGSGAAGFTVAKTATKTGRYTVTLVDTALKFKFAAITPIWLDDAAVTASRGVIPGIRDVDAGEGAADGTFEIQFIQPTNADAEAPDSTSFLLMIVAEI